LLPVTETQTGIAKHGISAKLTLKSQEFQAFEYFARQSRQSL
jgi:hypothetical protein